MNNLHKTYLHNIDLSNSNLYIQYPHGKDLRMTYPYCILLYFPKSNAQARRFLLRDSQ